MPLEALNHDYNHFIWNGMQANVALTKDNRVDYDNLFHELKKINSTLKPDDTIEEFKQKAEAKGINFEQINVDINKLYNSLYKGVHKGGKRKSRRNNRKSRKSRKSRKNHKKSKRRLQKK